MDCPYNLLYNNSTGRVVLVKNNNFQSFTENNIVNEVSNRDNIVNEVSNRDNIFNSNKELYKIDSPNSVNIKKKNIFEEESKVINLKDEIKNKLENLIK